MIGRDDAAIHQNVIVAADRRTEFTTREGRRTVDVQMLTIEPEAAIARRRTLTASAIADEDRPAYAGRPPNAQDLISDESGPLRGR